MKILMDEYIPLGDTGIAFRISQFVILALTFRIGQTYLRTNCTRILLLAAQ